MVIVQIFRSALPARAGTGPLKSGSARPSEYVHACVCDQLLSRVWLFCDPRDCSLPDSSVHGVFQARILDWVAMSSCRGPFWPRDQTQVSCIAGKFFITEPPGKPRPLDLPQQKTGPRDTVATHWASSRVLGAVSSILCTLFAQRPTYRCFSAWLEGYLHFSYTILSSHTCYYQLFSSWKT